MINIKYQLCWEALTVDVVSTVALSSFLFQVSPVAGKMMFSSFVGEVILGTAILWWAPPAPSPRLRGPHKMHAFTNWPANYLLAVGFVSLFFSK